jgi:hypothetical protein
VTSTKESGQVDLGLAAKEVLGRLARYTAELLDAGRDVRGLPAAAVAILEETARGAREVDQADHYCGRSVLWISA